MWLRGLLQDYARQILLDGQTHRRGYFSPERVEQLLSLHASGQADHGHRIWALLVLELWHRQFVDV
jgi:asparagine synthase (glutamine-hydrolysing)